MNRPADKPLYAVQDIPGKGKGLVATANIIKGTRILSEQAAIALPFGLPDKERRKIISQQLKTLNNDARNAFLSLQNRFPTKSQYVGIFNTNSLCIKTSTDEGSFVDQAAIFLIASLINHNCENNAQQSWNNNTRRHNIHALRDIQEGEEITLSYVFSLLDRAGRQALLKKSFNFTCSCRLCSLPIRESQRRDGNVQRVAALDEVAKHQRSTAPLQSLQCYHCVLAYHLSKYGREDCEYAQAHGDVATLLVMYGDLARGRYFAQKAASVFRTLLGSDSNEAAEFAAMARDPSRHPQYGFSMKWKTSVDEIPYGLGSADLENWRWERLIPEGISPFADIPSKEHFVKGGTSKKRHWCYMGEIVKTKLLHPVQLEVKDSRDKKVALHFYSSNTSDTGNSLRPGQYQKGYTVVILDALQYRFEFGCGINQQDLRMMKIFPLRLAKILALNKEVREFSIRHDDGKRKCHGCGAKAAVASMKRCSLCLSFWYCSKECQTAAWTTKAHKADCKSLRDPDLRGLFFYNWDEAQDSISFPLQVADDSC
ncbi:hypothetical protein E4U09_003561 [Claviceps aff. purpurea]|uniref:MYND-type zinc finger protein samB n=1 Tax=Claviceps aff. purpurea TaxID=1967640 RepID=A0A9P7QJ24_9HYPO|nr:hypothetical protein E4U09_003561 [Claviceps aff. purpurea]